VVLSRAEGKAQARQAHDQPGAALRWARIGGPDCRRHCWRGSPVERVWGERSRTRQANQAPGKSCGGRRRQSSGWQRPEALGQLTARHHRECLHAPSSKHFVSFPYGAIIMTFQGFGLSDKLWPRKSQTGCSSTLAMHRALLTTAIDSIGIAAI
jgi:hypothetical protein